MNTKYMERAEILTKLRGDNGPTGHLPEKTRKRSVLALFDLVEAKRMMMTPTKRTKETPKNFYPFGLCTIGSLFTEWVFEGQTKNKCD